MSAQHSQRIGAYRILRKLGEGGMGSVFEAEHISIARRVAIKVLHSSFANDSESVARFFNEARAVNLIEHPGLVQILDYGQKEDGTAYFVMELLRGETLRSRLQRCRAGLPVPAVLHISRQLASVLAAAHGRGIVHRDLKPDNIMLVPDPEAKEGERVKLLDFGIAKLAQEADAGGVHTRTNMVVGTPAYMAPEQCRSASRVDDRADAYSLGVVVYEMLAGRRPFLGSSPGELMGQHLFLCPPAVCDLVAGVPASLGTLIGSLLSKDREQRPRMAFVVSQLEKLGEPYGLHGRRSGMTTPERVPTAGRETGGRPEPEVLSVQDVLSLQSRELLSVTGSVHRMVSRPRSGGRPRWLVRPRAALISVGTLGLFSLLLWAHTLLRPRPPGGPLVTVLPAPVRTAGQQVLVPLPDIGRTPLSGMQRSGTHLSRTRLSGKEAQPGPAPALPPPQLLIPNSAEPKPAAPQPAEPQPAEPQPAEPQPAEKERGLTPSALHKRGQRTRDARVAPSRAATGSSPAAKPMTPSKPPQVGPNEILED